MGGGFVFVDHIVSIQPDLNRVVIRDDGNYPHIPNSSDITVGGLKLVQLLKDESMVSIKFEFIKHLKTLSDPYDRVADFECRRDDGTYCFDTEDRLIEGRKTIKEKQLEIDEDNRMRELCHKFKIPYESTVKGGL